MEKIRTFSKIAEENEQDSPGGLLKRASKLLKETVEEVEPEEKKRPLVWFVLAMLSTGVLIVGDLDTCDECDPRFVNVDGDNMTGLFRVEATDMGLTPDDSIYLGSGTTGIYFYRNQEFGGLVPEIGIRSPPAPFNILVFNTSIGLRGTQIFTASPDNILAYGSLRHNGTAQIINVTIGNLIIIPDTEIAGSLEVIGNITAENVFIPTHAFGATNITQTVAVADIWYTINWSHTHIEGPWAGNSTHMVVSDAGHYVTCYGANFHDDSVNPDSNNALRVNVNGAEQNHSYIEVDIRNRNRDIWLRNCVWVVYQSGDAVSIEYISSDTDVSISSDCTYSSRCNYAFADMMRVT